MPITKNIFLKRGFSQKNIVSLHLGNLKDGKMLKNRFTEQKVSRSKRAENTFFSACKLLIMRHLPPPPQPPDNQAVAVVSFSKYYNRTRLDLWRYFTLQNDTHKFVRVYNSMEKGGCFLAGSPVRC